MYRTDEDFEDAKQAALEKVVPHLLHPDLFPQPRLTQEEIAVLWAENKDDVKSKMAICKFEAKTLSKLRRTFESMGIHSADDVFNLGRLREIGKAS